MNLAASEREIPSCWARLTVVYGFGQAAHVAVNLLGRDVEDDGGGAAVNVFAALEGFDEAFFAGQVGQDAQLDL